MKSTILFRLRIIDLDANIDNSEANAEVSDVDPDVADNNVVQMLKSRSE